MLRPGWDGQGYKPLIPTEPPWPDFNVMSCHCLHAGQFTARKIWLEIIRTKIFARKEGETNRVHPSRGPGQINELTVTETADSKEGDV